MFVEKSELITEAGRSGYEEIGEGGGVENGEGRVQNGPDTEAQLSIISPGNWYLMAAYNIGLVLFIGCLILLVVSSVYELQMADTTYVAANCTVVDSNYTGYWRGCSCGSMCSSQFPCLQITVEVKISDKITNLEHTKAWWTMLYDSEYELQQLPEVRS